MDRETLKRMARRDGRKSLSRIAKIKDKGFSSYEDKQFLKTVQYAKGSNSKWKLLVAKRSGKCESYIDLSLIKPRE